MQIDLKLDEPWGYEFTGEFRQPKKGDYYYEPIDKKARLCSIDFMCQHMFILRKIDTWRPATINDLKRVKAGEKVECRTWDGVMWKEYDTLIGCSIYPCADIYWQVRGKDGFYSNWTKCEVKES